MLRRRSSSRLLRISYGATRVIGFSFLIHQGLFLARVHRSGVVLLWFVYKGICAFSAFTKKKADFGKAPVLLHGDVIVLERLLPVEKKSARIMVRLRETQYIDRKRH